MRSSRLSLLVLAAVCALAALLPAAASAAVHVKSLGTFGEFGKGAGQLREPGGGEYAGDGDYYVVDKGNDRIDVFGPDGKFKFTFGKGVNGEDQSDLCKAGEECVPGVAGSKAGYLQAPEDLALAAGKVYVTDPGNDRVAVFSEAGKFLFVFGGDVGEDGKGVCENDPCRAGKSGPALGELKEPSGIVAAPITGGRGPEELVVADTGNNRLVVYEISGRASFASGLGVGGGPNFEACWKACGAGIGSPQAGSLDGPTSLTWGRFTGDLYVASPVNNRVDLVYFGTQYAWSFGAGVGGEEIGVCNMQTGCQKGASNFEAGSLPDPTGIVSTQNKEIYVADGQANRVSKFDPNGNFIRAWGMGVKDGSPKLQICAATCRKGAQGTAAGAINAPTSLTIGPNGSLVLTETQGKLGPDLSRVQTMEETPGTKSPGAK
jgi:DNA-binding beta-propeller fold protein YncE